MAFDSENPQPAVHDPDIELRIAHERETKVDLEGYYRAMDVTDGGESCFAERHGIIPDDEMNLSWKVTANGPVRVVSGGEACGRVDSTSKPSPIKGA